MMDVSFLAEAMAEAGYKSNKALAEAAGMSSGAVGRILKRGTCNQFSAEKLQAACNPHKIGPLMQPEGVSASDRVAEDEVLASAFPGRPWFKDVDKGTGLTAVTGTRLDDDGLIEWGVVVYDPDGKDVAEDWGYDAHWLPRAEGKRLMAEGV